MLEPYIAPELKFIGETNEVVLGSLNAGNDFYSQRMPPCMEFDEDDEPWSLTQGD
jgi:hypothetical protein